MSIEDYDKASNARQVIKDIDKIIYDIDSSEFGGICSKIYTVAFPFYHSVNDPILKERFKNLLIERKQELIKEYFE